MSSVDRARTRQGRRGYTPQNQPRDLRQEQYFQVFRSVEPDLAAHVSQELYVRMGHIPGIEIAGRQDVPPARVLILRRKDTLDHPGIQTMERTDLDTKLQEVVPGLGSRVSPSVKNIGAFGLQSSLTTPGSRVIPIGAYLDEGQGAASLASARGQLEGLVCELDGWLPVSLESMRFHAVFVGLPEDSKPSQIADAKRAIHELTPPNLTLEKPDFEIC